MKLAGSLGPLAEREFRLLFLGRLVSFLGSAFAPVAIAFAVLEVGSASDLGLVLAAALAGIVVAAVGPAWGLAVDAASYFLAAAFLARIQLPSRTQRETPAFVRELVEGWDEFRSRTWLWVVVVAFGLLNAAQAGSFNVLGPAIAKSRLGGAASWGFILAALSAGLIVGGLLALRLRPRHALLIGCLCVTFQIPPLLLLAVPAPTVAIAGAAFAEGVGIELFGIYWDTSLQQHVPRDALARVSSYDALGSWVLMPIGFAVAGPIAALVGTRETLLGASALIAVAVVAMVATRDIRRLTSAPHIPPAAHAPEAGAAPL